MNLIPHWKKLSGCVCVITKLSNQHTNYDIKQAISMNLGTEKVTMIPAKDGLLIKDISVCQFCVCMWMTQLSNLFHSNPIMTT